MYYHTNTTFPTKQERSRAAKEWMTSNLAKDGIYAVGNFTEDLRKFGAAQPVKYLDRFLEAMDDHDWESAQAALESFDATAGTLTPEVMGAYAAIAQWFLKTSDEA